MGSTVLVRGVVIAEAGRLGTPPLLAIGDATGGLPVRLPDGTPTLARGTQVEVRGSIADPYGQTEVRPKTSGITVLGTMALPAPITMPAGDAGERTEGRLATIRGTISTAASKATSGDIAFTITGTDGASLRVQVDASAGMDKGAFTKGTVASFTGVVGQRASRKGALDGYRLWLRDAADMAATTSPPPTSKPSPSSSSAPSATSVSTIAAARVTEGTPVTVEGVLTVDRTLLDATGRRTIVEDATGAIELYLSAPDEALHMGVRVRVTGTVGRAWGAPRLHADQVRVLGTRDPLVHALKGTPSAASEWRLVRVSGTIASVHRSGDRWVAELLVGRSRVLLQGLGGSGVAADSLIEGRQTTITGIVKRPYPTATDRRFSVVPRRPSDVRTAAGAGGAGGTGDSTAAGPSGAPAGSPLTGGGRVTVPDIDLRDLAGHVGERVRVGGLVTDIREDGVHLDDGTAIGRIVLEGDAAALAVMLQPGDALNATGSPESRGEIVLVVSDAAGIELVGDLDGVGPDPGAGGGAATAVLPSGLAGAMDTPPATRAAFGQGMGIDPTSAGAGTLALVTLISVALTVARRHRAQRLLQSRIVARLATVGLAAPPRASATDAAALAEPSAVQSGAATGGSERDSA